MKSSLLKSISFVAFFAMATPAMADDPVVAVVDGHKISYTEVMAAKSALPKQYKSIPEDKLFPILLNQAVDSYLINKAAMASGEENNPDVKKAIEKAKEDIVSQAFLLGKVKGVITDEAVKAKYAEVLKNFPEEKEVHLRHILVDTEQKAKAVIKALKNKGDFKKIAKLKSKDSTAKEGGDLGFFRKSELPKELADAAFAMTAGSFSQTPVKTDFGWHVLKVEGMRDAKPPAFEDIKKELRALMTQEAIVSLIKDLRTKAKVELFDKDGKPIPKEPKKSADKPAESDKKEAATADTKKEAAPAEKSEAPAAAK